MQSKFLSEDMFKTHKHKPFSFSETLSDSNVHPVLISPVLWFLITEDSSLYSAFPAGTFPADLTGALLQAGVGGWGGE